MKYLTLSELVKMPTKRILAYKRKHFYNCVSPEDFLKMWKPSCKEELDKIKNDWQEYCMIKEVLSHRPHVEKENKTNGKLSNK